MQENINKNNNPNYNSINSSNNINSNNIVENKKIPSLPINRNVPSVPLVPNIPAIPKVPIIPSLPQVPKIPSVPTNIKIPNFIEPSKLDVQALENRGSLLDQIRSENPLARLKKINAETKKEEPVINKKKEVRSATANPVKMI